MGSRGKLDGTRGTRGGQRGRLETRFDSIHGSFFPFILSSSGYIRSLLHLLPNRPLPAIVCKLSEHKYIK